MPFQARIGIYEGPLDILLLLVRRGEIDPREVPVAEIVEQFLAFLAQGCEDFLGEAGDFLALVSLLLEVKSQYLLPHPEEAAVEVEYQQQERLVERLLAYEQFRRAAMVLEEKARQWWNCFARMVREPEPDEPAPAPLEVPSVWDLLAAFQKVMDEAEASKPTNIVYDDTPIHVYMDRVLTQLQSRGRKAFRELFSAGMTRATLVSMLLAVLELVVLGKVVVEQKELFGEIWLVARIGQSPEGAEGNQPASMSPSDAPSLPTQSSRGEDCSALVTPGWEE